MRIDDRIPAKKLRAEEQIPTKEPQPHLVKEARVSPSDEREIEPGRILRRDEAEEKLKLFDMNTRHVHTVPSIAYLMVFHPWDSHSSRIYFCVHASHSQPPPREILHRSDGKLVVSPQLWPVHVDVENGQVGEGGEAQAQATPRHIADHAGLSRKFGQESLAREGFRRHLLTWTNHWVRHCRWIDVMRLCQKPRVRGACF